jgi:hypothetical protein
MKKLSESNYIEWLKTFAFDSTHRKQLLKKAPRMSSERRQKLDLALTAIEAELRTYRVDLRLPRSRGKNTLSPILMKAGKHARSLRQILKLLATEYRMFDQIRYFDGTLLKFAADLEPCESLLEILASQHEAMVSGRSKGQSGRPRNEYGFIVALAVGRELQVQGFDLIKSRESLFYMIYAEILTILDIQKTDPYNMVARACDWLNGKEDFRTSEKT